VCHTGQTGTGLDRQHFGFRARTNARFGSGGRGSSGWSGKFVGGQFARCSPPRAQYGDGGVVALSWRGGMLIFEFQVGDLKNIWLIDSDCSRHMTGDKGWFSGLAWW
jgi:hypothetical protein